MDATRFEAAKKLEITIQDTTIFARRMGEGSALLLLHGFPETHLMWRDIAPVLASNFTVICADLRGYGQSTCPNSAPDHTPYSKRTLAADMVSVMEQLGFATFSVAGHDRGGRVAYRLALDHPERVERLAVLDIVPTSHVWDKADSRFALTYWPWSFLAQPTPLPERLIEAAPDAVIDHALTGWGSSGDAFPPDVRETYIQQLRSSSHVHAICEEYRAAATIDDEHDRQDQKNHRRIACPLLALWSKEGPLDTWYNAEGGPLAIWRQWADDVTGWAVEGGHFFPEEHPKQTAATLSSFFSAS